MLQHPLFLAPSMEHLYQNKSPFLYTLLYIGLDKNFGHIHLQVLISIRIFYVLNTISSKWDVLWAFKTLCSILGSLEKFIVLFSPLLSHYVCQGTSALSNEKPLTPYFVTHNLKHIPKCLSRLFLEFDFKSDSALTIISSSIDPKITIWHKYANLSILTCFLVGIGAPEIVHNIVIAP